MEGHPPAGFASQEVDPLEYLPDALVKVYAHRKTPSALEGLINLHLDGHYQETLDEVRYSLFLQHPEAFAAILSRQSDSALRRQAQTTAIDSFTSMFVYELSEDRDLRKRVTQLKQSLSKQDTSSAKFLRRYLTLLLYAAHTLETKRDFRQR